MAIAEVSKEVAESLGLPRARGALIRNIEVGAPADKAGLEPGDIILSFGDKPIEKSSDLPRIVGDTKPGTTSSIMVWRKGAQKEFNLTVADLEPTPKAAAQKEFNITVADLEPTPKAAAKKAEPEAVTSTKNAFGVSVTDVSDAKKKELSIKSGVEVTGLAEDGALAKAGARVGDVIVRLGDVDIIAAKQFDVAMKAEAKNNKSVAVFIRRGDSTLVIPVKPATK